MNTPTAYIPMDRRQAIVKGDILPQHTNGAALFADISGFTPLTEALALELGPRRGAEELTIHLNRVYEALIAELHRFGGSVIGFSGDAITCWFDSSDEDSPTVASARATQCALSMQQAMEQFAQVHTHSDSVVSLGMKAAVAAGSVRRFTVGDPENRTVDTMAGTTLENLAAAEHQAERGDVILESLAAELLAADLLVTEWREDGETGQRFAVVTGLSTDPLDDPWLDLDNDALDESTKKAWLLPPVYERLNSGQGEFLAELRPAVALFLKFAGIHYENDPDAPRKLDTFIRQVQQILTRYQGNLIQLTIGDKGSYMYAAFGAPIAHEDDGIRACSAGLELEDLAAGLDYLNDVQIGITTGRMRTGAYGSTTRRTYGVLGDAVNLAARLMAAAKPAQILVSDAAVALTGDNFTWEQLPDMRVKGKSEPVTLARLLGLKKPLGIGLQEPAYALPMVGREEELEQIETIVSEILRGRGQIVGITAEAGMGKSRLAAEVNKSARKQGFSSHGGECQSFGTNSSYLVWQNIWRSLFGIDSGLSIDAQIEILKEALLHIDPLLVGRLPLLGAVLNLPIPDNDLTRSLDAKVRKTSLESLLSSVLSALSSTQPLLIVLEDLHWIDPLSTELIEEIGRTIAGLPVLLLLVYRPSNQQGLRLPKVESLPHFTEIELTEFTDKESARLIELKLGQFFGPDATVPEAFRQRITDQAAGNPFYIEELINYLQDLAIDPSDQDTVAAIDLPDSVYSLILSRMDQLTETEQITMKVASVIGRMFRASMVWGIYPELGELQRVRQHLDILSEMELTPLDVPDPELIYLFKHIITQQVAYESLLFTTRSVLHNEIGQYIERVYADEIEQHVDLLAFHYEHSENEEKKRQYLLFAGDIARREYANTAAINYMRKAIPLLKSEDEMDTRLKLGNVYDLIGEYGGAETQYKRALKLSRQFNNLSVEGWSATYLGELCRKMAKYEDAQSWLSSAKERFEQAGDLAGVGQALHYAGTLAAQQGEFQLAKGLYNQSLSIREQLDDQRKIASLLSNLAIVARFEGDMENARDFNQQSLSIREALGDRWDMAVSLNNLGNLNLQEGHLAPAREYFERALTIWQEIGERWATANTLHNLANVARDEGNYATAHHLYGESIQIWQDLGDSWALAYWIEDMALFAALQGQKERAMQLAAKADVFRSEANIPLAPSDADRFESRLKQVRESLTVSELTSALDSGRLLSLDEAVQLALL